MRNKRSGGRKGIRVAVLVLLAVVAVNIVCIPMVSRMGDSNGAYAYSEEWYEDANLPVGNWYSDYHNPIIIEDLEVSFMKIYSLGSTLRVMEVSTYPRAYKDTSDHTYGVDTPFVVSEEDTNGYYDSDSEMHPRPEIEDGTRVYRDPYVFVFLEGETAIHYSWEPLPGVFPLWVESEELPMPSWANQKDDVFPFVFGAVKGELVQVEMHEGVYREDVDAGWTPMPQELFDTYVTLFTDAESEIKVTKIVKNKDRIILRVIYDKAVSG